MISIFNNLHQDMVLTMFLLYTLIVSQTARAMQQPLSIHQISASEQTRIAECFQGGIEVMNQKHGGEGWQEEHAQVMKKAEKTLTKLLPQALDGAMGLIPSKEAHQSTFSYICNLLWIMGQTLKNFSIKFVVFAIQNAPLLLARIADYYTGGLASLCLNTVMDLPAGGGGEIRQPYPAIANALLGPPQLPTSPTFVDPVCKSAADDMKPLNQEVSKMYEDFKRADAAEEAVKNFVAGDKLQDMLEEEQEDDDEEVEDEEVDDPTDNRRKKRRQSSAIEQLALIVMGLGALVVVFGVFVAPFLEENSGICIAPPSSSPYQHSADEGSGSDSSASATLERVPTETESSLIINEKYSTMEDMEHQA